MAAYWLAHTFHQHPDAFLALEPVDLVRHLDRTIKMLKKTQPKRP